MTINEIRKAKLEELISEYGGLRALAAKLDHSASAQLSQWRQSSPDSKTGKPRTISDRSARTIELKCGKAVGWMDTADQTVKGKSMEDFHWIMENGTESEKSILLATIGAIKSVSRQETRTEETQLLRDSRKKA